MNPNNVVTEEPPNYQDDSIATVQVPEFKKYISELIGTYIFLFLGISSIIVSQISNSIGNGGIALVFGMSICILIYFLGDISGADFNPAVSIAKCIIGKHSIREGVIYCMCQFIGGILSCLTLSNIFGQSYIKYALTLPTIDIMHAAMIEFILTVFLVSIILWSSFLNVKYSALTGLFIGGVIGIEALVFGPVTGASMNPIRTIAPALISGNRSNIVVYTTAILAGGIVSAMIYKYINK